MARISIRRAPRSAGSLTAAAQKITDPAKSFKSQVASGADDWQQKAWAYLGQVGELRYYVTWRSAAVSRCRLVASDIDPVDGQPTGHTENLRAAEIVRNIAGGLTGQIQLLRRLAAFLTVPGEGYVVMAVRQPLTGPDAEPLPVPPGTEQWAAISRAEIQRKGADQTFISMPDGSKHALDLTQDLFFRVWEPDPEKAALPTSPVRANLSVLNEIMRATATIDNAAKSRLVGNGIVFVPQQMSLPTQQTPRATPPEGQPVNGEPTQWGQGKSQQLQELLFDAASAAYEDQESMAALIPLIAGVPGEWIKEIKHVRFDAEVSEKAIKAREAAIRRLALGLDVSPERLLGLSSGNHWSAWAIGDDDVRVHVVPVLELICDALTQQVLRPMLEAEGLDPEAFCVWYDTAPLTQDPDKKDEALQAHNAGALTSEALLKHLGFSEEEGYDFNTLAGWQQWARDKVSAKPELITQLAPLLGTALPELAPEPAAVEAPPTPAPEVEVDSEPAQEPDDNEPVEGEVIASASKVLARIAVKRALEMAGKRLRTRETHALCRDVPAYQAYLRLGPQVGEVTKLIMGWGDSIEDQDLAQLGVDPILFRAAVQMTAADALRRCTSPDFTLPCWKGLL